MFRQVLPPYPSYLVRRNTDSSTSTKSLFRGRHRRSKSRNLSTASIPMLSPSPVASRDDMIADEDGSPFFGTEKAFDGFLVHVEIQRVKKLRSRFCNNASSSSDEQHRIRSTFNRHLRALQMLPAYQEIIQKQHLIQEDFGSEAEPANFKFDKFLDQLIRKDDRRYFKKSLRFADEIPSTAAMRPWELKASDKIPYAEFNKLVQQEKKRKEELAHNKRMNALKDNIKNAKSSYARSQLLTNYKDKQKLADHLVAKRFPRNN